MQVIAYREQTKCTKNPDLSVRDTFCNFWTKNRNSSHPRSM